MHPRQYLVSREQNILYPPKFIIGVFIIVDSMLTVHIIWRRALMVDAKMHQNAQICTLQFKIFPVTMLPSPHVGEGLRRLSPTPIPLGTPALRAFGASLGPQLSPNVC